MATMRNPGYTYRDFVSACKKGVSDVYVIKGAMKTAKEDFELKTQGDVLKFIARGLEKLEWVNTKDWENNPNPTIKILVDAYTFAHGVTRRGYIAFLFNNVTSMWLVKSFRNNEDPGGKFKPFEALGNLFPDVGKESGE
jgi:hypothetical protein